MNNNVKVGKKLTLNPIVKGYLISLVISIIFLFIYAVVLVNTNIQENTIKPVIIIITAISILIGSSISSLKIKKRGIINGLCIGGLYVSSLYILSSIAIVGFSINIASVIVIGIGIIIGAIGGIIGVNMKQ